MSTPPSSALSPDDDAAADVADADAVAAASPLTPAAELARIATYRPDLHAVLATNPSTYPSLVDWLRQSEDPEVQASLAARFARPGAAPAPPPPPAAASAPVAPSAPVVASAPSSLPALPPGAGTPASGSFAVAAAPRRGWTSIVVVTCRDDPLRGSRVYSPATTLAASTTTPATPMATLAIPTSGRTAIASGSPAADLTCMSRSMRYSTSAGITSASAAPNHAPGRPAALSASALSERINAVVAFTSIAPFSPRPYASAHTSRAAPAAVAVAVHASAMSPAATTSPREAAPATQI